MNAHDNPFRQEDDLHDGPGRAGRCFSFSRERPRRPVWPATPNLFRRCRRNPPARQKRAQPCRRPPVRKKSRRRPPCRGRKSRPRKRSQRRPRRRKRRRPRSADRGEDDGTAAPRPEGRRTRKARPRKRETGQVCHHRFRQRRHPRLHQVHQRADRKEFRRGRGRQRKGQRVFTAEDLLRRGLQSVRIRSRDPRPDDGPLGRRDQDRSRASRRGRRASRRGCEPRASAPMTAWSPRSCR